MDSPSAQVVIRNAEFSDEAFIMACWLNGMRYGNSYFEEIEAIDYFKGYSENIKRIFQTPNTTIEIACLSEDPGTIVGYIVYTNEVIHWLFVKSDYRNQGIARLLYQNKRLTTSSSLTKIGRSLIRKFGIKFNPYF